MVPFDDDSEMSSFFQEEGSQTQCADGFQNSDNLANIQQWPGDEWAFFADSEYEQTTELWVDIASIEPVGPDRPPDYVAEDIHDWWEGYDDPIVSDAEWSGPIQPNAPPILAFDDAWDFDSDQALEPGATADSFQNSDVVVATPIYDDAWDWDTDAVLEDSFEIDQALGAGTQPSFQPFDLDWNEEDGSEDYELVIDDFANFELDPSQPDAWDWEADAAFEDAFDIDQPIGADLVIVPSQPPEDPWDWDSESALDESAVLAPLDAVIGADFIVPPSQPIDDAWDWDTENALDEWLDVTDQVIGPDVIGGGLAAADSWDWDSDYIDEALDGIEQLTGADLVTIPSPPADVDNDFGEAHEDEWAQYVDQSANVNGPHYPGTRRFVLGVYPHRKVLAPYTRRFLITVPNQTVVISQLAGSNFVYEFDVSLIAVREWEANASITAGSLLRPSVTNETGFLYQATASGQTGALEPAWAKTAGATVVDGSLTLTTVVPPASGEDSIASVTWTQQSPPDGTLTVTGQSNTSLVAAVYFGGGTSGNVYTILGTITMASGAIYPVKVILTIL